MSERVYNAKTSVVISSGLSKSKRHWELDFLRGLCVILMVIDHFFFSAMDFLPSIWSFFGQSKGQEFWRGLNQLATIYWYNNAHTIAHYTVVTMFFLICGISCTLSHNNALRGVKTLAAGIVITIGTYLADSFFNLNALIIFGVIHMLGCAILLFSLVDLAGWGIQKLIGRFFKTDKASKTGDWVRKLLPMAVGIIGLIVFFALPLGRFIREKSLTLDMGLDEKVNFPPYTELVSDISVSGTNGLKTFLSFFLEFNNFYPKSADYFPIFPYAFIVLIGSGIGRLVYDTKAREFSDYIIVFPIGLVLLIASCIRWLYVDIINSIKRLARNDNFLKHSQYFLIRVNLDKKWNKSVNFVGRKALIVYLLHQIVIVVFLYAMGGIYSIG